MLAGLAEFYQAGGIWMHPIAAMSVVLVAITIERVIALYFRLGINATTFMAQIQKLVLANNVDRAIKLCNASPRAALPRVIKAALTRANKSEVEIENALEEASVESLRELSKRTSMLPNVANISTLLGLFGTVVGLIEAFKTVASAPPDMRNQLLTAAIAVALNTTGLGLAVAIPALGIYALLSNQTKKIVDDIDQYSMKLLHLLIARSSGGLAPQQSSGGTDGTPQAG